MSKAVRTKHVDSEEAKRLKAWARRLVSDRVTNKMTEFSDRQLSNFADQVCAISHENVAKARLEVAASTAELPRRYESYEANAKKRIDAHARLVEAHLRKLTVLGRLEGEISKRVTESMERKVAATVGEVYKKRRIDFTEVMYRVVDQRLSSMSLWDHLACWWRNR